METKELQAIAKTLTELATPEMKPKELMKEVKKRHPKASKKEILRGAFYAVISEAEANPEKAKKLHTFALEKGSSDE